MTETEPPSARLRLRLLEAFLPIAAEEGWTDSALVQAVRAAGMSEGEALLACPSGVADLRDAFAERADQAMLAELAQLDLAAMGVRDKVRAAIKARLRSIVPCRKAAANLGANPVRAAASSNVLWRTADRIWRAIGDSSTDFNFYTKRMILSAVLASVYLRWRDDESEDFADTWTFLDDRLENIIQFEKLKQTLKPLEGVADAAIGFAARLRYGR